MISRNGLRVIAFIKKGHESFLFRVQPHIYVVEWRRFGFLNPNGTSVSSDAVTEAQAKLVI